MADAADTDHDRGRAGHGEVREPADRVVGGEARIRVRRDVGRLDAVGQAQQRALRDDHVLGEAAVDRQAR